MRKHQIAESVLTWFTSRDRASAIVGDLAETGSFRWSTVVRIAAAFLWLDLKAAPAAHLTVLMIGALLSYAALAIIAPGMMGAMGWSRAEPDQRILIWLVAAMLWGRLIAPFLIGYVVVRLTPNRNLTACALLAILGELCLMGYWAQAMSHGHPSLFAGQLYLLNLLPALPLLAGGILVRRTAVRA